MKQSCGEEEILASCDMTSFSFDGPFAFLLIPLCAVHPSIELNIFYAGLGSYRYGKNVVEALYDPGISSHSPTCDILLELRVDRIGTRSPRGRLDIYSKIIRHRNHYLPQKLLH